MRRAHFETFRPVCPVCRTAGRGEHVIVISSVLEEREDDILQGILHCSHPGCLREYPILDGIPLFVPDLKSFLAGQHLAVLARDDLHDDLQSLVGDALGPGSVYDTTRQHLSSYASDHYPPAGSAPNPRSARALLTALLSLAPEPPSGPLLELGCSVGGGTFRLAERFDVPVLGIDLSYPMLRIASRALRSREARYPLRRVGLVFDQQRIPFESPANHRVDFWAADVLALPLTGSCVAGILSLNLLDCVGSPLDLLRVIEALLKDDGRLWLGTPYDWSQAVTDPGAWLGGHSQRSPLGGDSAAILRALLTDDAHPRSLERLRIDNETQAAWDVRLHDRSRVTYDCHLITAHRRRVAPN